MGTVDHCDVHKRMLEKLPDREKNSTLVFNAVTIGASNRGNIQTMVTKLVWTGDILFGHTYKQLIEGYVLQCPVQE